MEQEAELRWNPWNSQVLDDEDLKAYLSQKAESPSAAVDITAELNQRCLPNGQPVYWG